MIGTADRVMVAFQGEGSGEADLAWGQKENWSAIVAQGTWIPLGGVKPLSAGTTVEEIADELAYLMGRYQTMRTRLRFDEDGRPSQVVHADGEIALEVFDTAGDDPDDVAAAVHDRYRDTALDFAAEWPLRMAVVRHDGALTHMVVLISHLATDAAGAGVLMAEVAVRESRPVAGMQPLAQARWQASGSGLRQNDSSLRYWEGVLQKIDPVRFPPSRGEEQPRYWQAVFDSPAMFPAVQALADHSAVETSTVLMALFGLGLHEVTGIHPVVVRPIVSNRFRPGLADVVCTLSQGGLCVLDVAGVPFEEALRQAQRATMSAYKHAYFDHDDMVVLRARVAEERGLELDTACYFNDRRGPARRRDPGSEAPLRRLLDEAPAATLRWVLGQDAPSFEPLFLHIDDVPDTVQISVYLDTRSISRGDAETVVRGMESKAVAAALDLAESGVGRTGVGSLVLDR